jgi:hypothetical protein
MYVIRVSGDALSVTFSEHVHTDEALRAISQSFALADAGAIRHATVDLTGIEKGPANSLVIAVALASRMQPGLKVAFVCGALQRPYIRRIARFSGIREGLGLFESQANAQHWFAGNPPAERRLSSTERRHLQELARHRIPGASQGVEQTRRRGAA